MFDETDFHCAPPVAIARSIPTRYVREKTFSVFNLIAIAFAFGIGWVIGHLLRSFA